MADTITTMYGLMLTTPIELIIASSQNQMELSKYQYPGLNIGWKGGVKITIRQNDESVSLFKNPSLDSI